MDLRQYNLYPLYECLAGFLLSAAQQCLNMMYCVIVCPVRMYSGGGGGGGGIWFRHRYAASTEISSFSR